MRRLAAIATALLASLVVAGAASASVTQGGPWAPDVASVARISPLSWLATTDRGMFRTDDAGQTWTAVAAFPAAPGADPAPTDFAPQVVATGTGNHVYAIDANRTVADSADLGETWTFHEHRGAWWGLISLTADITRSGGLILMTNSDGVLVSQDGGVTWQPARDGAGAAIDDLANVQSLGNGKTIAIANAATGTYLESADGGLTWPTTRGVDGGVGFNLAGLVGTGEDNLVAIGYNGSTCPEWGVPASDGLDLALTAFQVKVSADAGLSWTDGASVCASGFVAGSGQWYPLVGRGSRVAFVSATTGLFVSGDGGATFNEIDKPSYLSSVHGFASLLTGDVVIAANTGVFLLSASGQVFARSTGIQSYSGLGGLAVAPGDTSTILASLGDRGLFRTTDAGATWLTAADMAAPQVHPTSVVQPPTFSDATHVAFAIDAFGSLSTADHNGLRIFSSADKGASWSLARVVEGYEPGGPIDFGAGGVAYIPIHLPYSGDMSDTSRCAVGVSDTAFSTFTAKAIRVGGVDAPCTKMTAVASDPANAQTLLAAGQDINASTGVLRAWRFYRSDDGGDTWSTPRGLGAAFPASMWAPPMHVSYVGSRVYVWQSRSSKLCTSTDGGASFACAEGAFATTPGGPGWFADGYLSSFEPQADGSIVASVVDPADWTDRNDALPAAGVTTYLARSVDGGVSWAIADPSSSAAITDVVDVAAQAAARSLRVRSAAGRRSLVLAAGGIFTRRVAFKRAARGSAAPRLSGIVVRKSGQATVTVTCPRGKRCAGYLRLTSRGRFTSSRTAFDVSRVRTVVVLRIPKAKAKRLTAGATIPVRVAITRTVGGAATYTATATVRR